MILSVAVPKFEQGKEIIIVGHSYGGIPATAATEGQGVAERAQRGERGGFKAMLFFAGFAIAKKGMDLLTSFGGKYPDWVVAGEYYSKVGCLEE